MMSIYEKELEDMDDIFNEVKKIFENESLGSKIEITKNVFSSKKRIRTKQNY